jgi:hypothetical protein
MGSHTYKMIELVGSSPESSDAAIRNAVARASETLHYLDWFEVTETRGHLVDGKIAHWQVTLKVGMRLEGGEGAGKASGKAACKKKGK